MQLDYLDFADDLTLLLQTQQQIREKISVAAASTAVGLNTHKAKTKIRRCNTTCVNRITLDGEALKDIKTYTNLVSIIDEQGGSDADVKARIGKARAAYLQLKDIWNSKQLSTNTKVDTFRLYEVLLVRALSNSECLWHFKVQMVLDRIKAFAEKASVSIGSGSPMP
ncbi:unnamed protein product [Schistosoma margrebowiei]|uniref:Uncharacterized protein n=1 Tax=Schistosoma margrebowiei TaxID=48269 RepID=A0A183N312_9TREM|nr:unnamed protein product [Schistosoma margrebowiei]